MATSSSPTSKFVTSLYVYLSVSWSVYLSACLSCLSVCLSVCLCLVASISVDDLFTSVSVSVCVYLFEESKSLNAEFQNSLFLANGPFTDT